MTRFAIIVLIESAVVAQSKFFRAAASRQSAANFENSSIRLSAESRYEPAVEIDLLWLALKYISVLVADVAELADALDSKSSIFTDVWVRPPPSAPYRQRGF